MYVMNYDHKGVSIQLCTYSLLPFQAILGQILFGEIVTILWWMGTVLILCGLLLMHHASNVPPRKPGTRPKMH